MAYFVNNETECTTVSVNTITEQQISIYPNPTSGIVHVDLAGKKIQNLKLIDVTGKIVIEKTNANTTTLMDVSSLAKGIYFVILQTENGNQSFKLVKE